MRSIVDDSERIDQEVSRRRCFYFYWLVSINKARHLCISHSNNKYYMSFALCDIGGERVGANPKINNIHPGYVAAKHELIMISDSGLRST